jgi:hypothetical protein
VKSKSQAILISGLPPSSGGVGRLMKNLISVALDNNFLVVVRREPVSLRSLLIVNKFSALLRELSFRAYDSLLFFTKTYFLVNKTILFIHPQTAGMGLLNRLTSRNKVYLYVMDNSFFCIRSYNIHPILRNECTNCIGDPSRFHLQCSPFPVAGNPNKMVDSLRMLQNNVHKITFLAQNDNQNRLLKLHFGQKCRSIVVGMDTNELGECSEPNNHNLNFDVVFHGNVNIAKGSIWFLEVAELLPQIKFFMPCTKFDMELVLGRSIQVQNITFRPCSWENGLRDAVESAKLVCVPSLWSAPIEGALLKSILCNGEVAVVKTEYGFSQEIAENVLLHLSSDPTHAALEISRHLSSNTKFKVISRQWLEFFNSKNSASNVFKAIN